MLLKISNFSLVENDDDGDDDDDDDDDADRCLENFNGIATNFVDVLLSSSSSSLSL